MRQLIIFSLVVASIFITKLNAQNLRLNLYGNYAFDDEVNLYNVNTTLKGGLLYGGGLEYTLGPKFAAELQYQRMASDLSYYYSHNNTTGSDKVDYSLNYIMVGLTNYLPLPYAIKPYYGVLLGMSIANIQTNALNMESNVKFAWGARLGTEIPLSKQLSIRLQGELRSIVESVDANLNIGIGGINPSISTNSVMYQFNLGGGLVYVLK